MVKEAETVPPLGTSTVAGTNVIPELVGVSVMAPPTAGWSSDMVTAALATPFATTLVAVESETAVGSVAVQRRGAHVHACVCGWGCWMLHVQGVSRRWGLLRGEDGRPHTAARQ